MLGVRFQIITLLLLLTSTCVAMSCRAEPTQRDSSWTDDGGADGEGASDRDTEGTDSSRSEPTQEGCRSPLALEQESSQGFEKPQTELILGGDYRNFVAPENSQPGGAVSRTKSFFHPRDHMRPTSLVDEVWLHEGEYGVIDVGYIVTGEEPEPIKRYELFVFVDFKPVEFGFVSVNPVPDSEPFPTMEEVEAVDELVRSKTVQLNVDEPLVFTLVLPPRIFEQRGAYDVRVAMIGRPPPESSNAMGIGELLEHSMILNYGSTEFANANTIDVFEHDLEPVSPPDYQREEMHSFGSFLEPPEQVYDPTEFDPPSIHDDIDLGQVFEVTSDTARLRAWLHSFSEEPDAPMYFLVLDGDKVLDTPRGYVELPALPPNFWQSDEDYGVEFAFDIDVEPGRTHKLQLLSFEQPYCRSGEKDVRTSNILHVRQK